MKTRLLGAAVLIALAVLFVPMFFSGQPPAPGDQSVNLAIPQAPDRELQTRTMSLNPDGAAVAPAEAMAPAVSSDRLATVNIGSRRPRDVEIDPLAGKPPEPTTVTTGSGASPTQPVIPMQGAALPTPPAPKSPVPASAPPALSTPASKPASKVVPVASTAVASAPVAAPAPASTGQGGGYSLNLSAYASAANATALQRQVQALGYGVSSRQVSQAGKQLTLVSAGPFATRTAAEAARLKIAKAIPDLQAYVEQGADHKVAPAPAHRATTTAPAAAAKTGGWAVQLAALSSQADANALRDKLRANGFDGYVSSIQSAGRQLWRVRVGPQTQRADAQQLQAQIKAKLGVDGVVRQVP